MFKHACLPYDAASRRAVAGYAHTHLDGSAMTIAGSMTPASPRQVDGSTPAK
jgi:hypothetical protein